MRAKSLFIFAWAFLIAAALCEMKTLPEENALLITGMMCFSLWSGACWAFFIQKVLHDQE